MQLHAARLCLDCQEVHSETRCPVCASETFAPLSRWIPAEERRTRARADSAESVDALRRLIAPAPRQARSKWPTRAALVLATVGVGSWLWRRVPDGRGGEGERETGNRSTTK
ncbi:MAG TPA: hypothetical protein VGI12_06900 [Vicinamibacterales bacterium]|jgi:hypothetical protein